MPASDLDRQLLLIQKVGDIDADTGDWMSPFTPGKTGLVLQNIDILWRVYLDKRGASGSFGNELFENYVMRDAAELVLARLSELVTFSAIRGAISARLSDRIAARQAQVERFNKEILRVEQKINMAADPVMGPITAVVPITPPVPGARSNPYTTGPYGDDPVYSGSVYWPARRYGP